MDDVTQITAPVNSVRAILLGGPLTIPDEKRVQLVSPLDEKVKLPHYGGYEHFERIAAFDASAIAAEIAFYWTMRTEIAE